MDKERLKNFLKKRENQILVLIIVFSIIYRLFYFFKLGAQPIWWDEGDYLAISKVWSLGMEIPEWWAHFTGMRPLLLPIIWTIFFKLGFEELSIRFFTILLPSLGAIYLVYVLGKELYNKKIGLIAGFMFSVYWVFTFYTYRLLTDIPATFFGLLSFIFFYKGLKENRMCSFYLCALFGVLAFSTRFPLALVLITCFIYLFFIKKFAILKDRTFWKFILSIFIFAIPFVIYVIYTKFYFIKFFFIGGLGGAIESGQGFGFYIFGLSLSILKSIWIIAFVMGVFTLYKFFIGFDIFWKQKDKKFNADFFIILWIILQYFLYVFVFRGANDRWILMLTIPMLIICSKGIMGAYKYLKKYSKFLAIILFLFLLFGGAYQNITHANNLIEIKKDTYNEIKLGGLWLKENTPQDTKVITASIVQNQYYSERQSYDFYTNDSIWESCAGLSGQLSENETCQKLAEEAFNRKVEAIEPSYLIISVFEPAFTPQWAYTYPQRYNLTPVAAFPDNQQPMLVIYKF